MMPNTVGLAANEGLGAIEQIDSGEDANVAIEANDIRANMRRLMPFASLCASPLNLLVVITIPGRVD